MAGDYDKQQGPKDRASFDRLTRSNTYGEPAVKEFSTLINHPEVGLQYRVTDRWNNDNSVTDIAPIATSSWASKYAGMEKLQNKTEQMRRDKERLE